MATEDRRPYLSATVLDQALLDAMADNLDFGLQMVADIETPGATIYSSDRNKYVGGVFYQAICEFPTIKRTIGEWLSPTIEFSTLELPLSNVDGRFNEFLPGGATFDGWIGKEVNVRLGIRDSATTYSPIYKGRVTDVGGLSRDRAKITVRTRDQMDKLNQNFPRTALTATGFPDIEDGLAATILPVIYGDWTVAPLHEVPNPPSAPTLAASVPAFVTNGKNAGVLAGTSNVQISISENANSYLDPANVWAKRGDKWVVVPGANVTAISGGNNAFEVVQGFTFDAGAYVYQPGDNFYVRVRGTDLSTYEDNLVWQARDILLSYGGAVSGDFTPGNWEAYRDKASPSESALSTFKSRVWIQDPENVVSYVLSMFEQVRLEMFVDKNLQLKLSALHLDEFVASPSFVVKQWDLLDASFVPKLDDRNIWNRARAEYAFDPQAGANVRQSSVFKNVLAIAQAGKTISKKVVFPNLYEEGTVVAQLKEMLRLASGYPEFVEMVLTPRATLLDIGDFVKLRISMGSVVFDDVPAQIREIGYDRKGSIPIKVWSWQMTPFPGWTPGYSGTYGGSAATIDEET